MKNNRPYQTGKVHQNNSHLFLNLKVHNHDTEGVYYCMLFRDQTANLESASPSIHIQVNGKYQMNYHDD